MTEAKTEGLYNLTVPVPMKHPQLFEAKAYVEDGKPKGEPKFSVTLEFAPDNIDLAAIKKKSAALARTKWPDKPFFLTTQEGVKLKQVLFPWATGEEIIAKRKAKGKKVDETMAGKVYISSKSKHPVRLSVVHNGGIVDLENEALLAMHKAKFYAGALVLAEFNLVPYDAKGEGGLPGVTAYLNRIVSTGKGDRIVGGRSGAEAFKGYLGSISTESAMGPGADDSIDDLL